eukprot:g2755.t1
MEFTKVPRKVEQRVLTARGSARGAAAAHTKRASVTTDVPTSRSGSALPKFRYSKGRIFSLTPRDAEQAKQPVPKAAARPTPAPGADASTSTAHDVTPTPTIAPTAVTASARASKEHASDDVRLLCRGLGALVRAQGPEVVRKLRRALQQVAKAERAHALLGPGKKKKTAETSGASAGARAAPLLLHPWRDDPCGGLSSTVLDLLGSALNSVASRLPWTLRAAALRTLCEAADAARAAAPETDPEALVADAAATLAAPRAGWRADFVWRALVQGVPEIARSGHGDAGALSAAGLGAAAATGGGMGLEGVDEAAGAPEPAASQLQARAARARALDRLRAEALAEAAAGAPAPVDRVAAAVAAENAAGRAKAQQTLTRVRRALRVRAMGERPAARGAASGGSTAGAGVAAGAGVVLGFRAVRTALRHAAASSGAGAGAGRRGTEPAADLPAEDGASPGILARAQIALALNSLLGVDPAVDDAEVDELMALCPSVTQDMPSGRPPTDLPQPASFVRGEDLERLLQVDPVAEADARAAAAAARGAGGGADEAGAAAVPPLQLSARTVAAARASARGANTALSTVRSTARSRSSSAAGSRRAARPAPAQYTPRYSALVARAGSATPRGASAKSARLPSIGAGTGGTGRTSRPSTSGGGGLWQQAQRLNEIQDGFQLLRAPKPVLWDNISPVRGPPVRGEMSAVRHGRQLVMHGGCDIEFALFFNDTWAFDLDTESWSQLPTTGPAPSACGHGASVAGDSMLVFGGLTDGSGDELHVLDLRTLKWAQLHKPADAAWPPPRALLQHSMVPLPCTAADSSCGMVLSSGTSSDKADDESAWAFEWAQPSGPVAGRWRRLSVGQAGNVNVGGSSAVVVACETGTEPGCERATAAPLPGAPPASTLLVLGGFRTDLHAPNSTLDAFDMLPLSAVGAAEPPSRFVHVQEPQHGPSPRLAFQAAVVHAGCVVVVGGFDPASVSGDIWTFSLATRVWRRHEHEAGAWPAPHFAQAVVLDEGSRSLVAYGGRIHPAGHGEELATDVWRLHLDVLGC